MLNVGLTGGIGAGKSAVASRLIELGAVVIDSDVLAREVVAPGTSGLAQVVEVFGDGVLDAEGGLDRAVLARQVFGDENARAKLEGVIHPLVRRRSDQLVAEAAPEAVIVHDVPLLAEIGMAPRFDLVVVVEADETTRLERLVHRGLPRDQASDRIAAQTSDATRRAVADVVIDNRGTTRQLDTAVARLWRERLLPYEANKRLRRLVVPDQQFNLVGYHQAWTQQFTSVAMRLRRVLTDAAQRIDHVGSTAVPGLDAEPVIDIQVVVADMDTAESFRNALEAAGFPATNVMADAPGSPKRLHGGSDPAYPVSIHLRAVDSCFARSVLLLRDWLRADKRARTDYAAAKHRLKDSVAARTEYTRVKEPLFTGMLERAESWARRTHWTV